MYFVGSLDDTALLSYISETLEMAHEHAHRLIYAADLSFADCADFKEVHVKAARFHDEAVGALRETGVVFKGNTIFRVLGQIALASTAAAGLRSFADYKLFDVHDTCVNDLSWLRLVPNLEVLTICERVPTTVFGEAARLLPNTVIAPIYPLTDLNDADFWERGEINRPTAVAEFFKRAAKLPAKGSISSARDLQFAPEGFLIDHEAITPAIRPEWYFEPGDRNAVNALTPRKAILAGATRLVIGSPLRKNGALRDNTMRVLDEIGEALIELNGK